MTHSTLRFTLALLLTTTACTRTQDLGEAADAAAGDAAGPADLSCETLAIRNLDLLFMVDNSGSMREEQASLRREFPRLIAALTSGDREGDGVRDFPPVENLHLGVVSSDLGLLGIGGIDKCNGLGDNGQLLHEPNPEVTGCAAAYPPFLSYTAPDDDGITVANDFACISALGTDGCGFEQQLESTLKALWPASDDSIEFLGDTELGMSGQGELANAGFLRPASGPDTSAIGIVVVSDEEDCSSQELRHLTPTDYLPAGDPLAEQPLNLRCLYNPDNLFSVQRYVDGFRALRPGSEQLVVFSAIVGVPPELVDAQAMAGVDFSDDAERDAFYDALLDDPKMQEVVDPATTTTTGGGNLTPSCDTPTGKAYPPRRFVQLARELGENSLVQSICQADFSPAIDAIVARIGRTVRNGCVGAP